MYPKISTAPIPEQNPRALTQGEMLAQENTEDIFTALPRRIQKAFHLNKAHTYAKETLSAMGKSAISKLRSINKIFSMLVERFKKIPIFAETTITQAKAIVVSLEKIKSSAMEDTSDYPKIDLAVTKAKNILEAETIPLIEKALSLVTRRKSPHPNFLQQQVDQFGKNIINNISATKKILREANIDLSPKFVALQDALQDFYVALDTLAINYSRSFKNATFPIRQADGSLSGGTYPPSGYLNKPTRKRKVDELATDAEPKSSKETRLTLAPEPVIPAQQLAPAL